jgi:hypothetical protein
MGKIKYNCGLFISRSNLEIRMQGEVTIKDKEVQK